MRSTIAATLPYAATVLPLKGQLPAGQVFQSADDVSLKTSVLSTWPDGSAAVAVVAGTLAVAANATSTLRLQAASASSEAPLTAARISALVSSVAVDFGAPYGVARISSFGAPERIWWANAQVICARYRVQPATLQGSALECVIDIHAYAADRALVEIVVENAKFAAATSTLASLPAAASYTAAAVSVNGSAVATISGNAAPEGTHAATRAWYASTWIGGNPGLRVTQAHADLQQHPLLYKCVAANTADLSGYAADSYRPWTNGRQPFSSMGGVGDSAQIGPLPRWEATFLQTGDPRVANAVEVSALAVLGYNINTRDSVSGLVADASLLGNKVQNGSTANWPRIYAANDGGYGGDLGWEAAHCPAVGLMAFITRPSPVFIELAQKVAVWQATNVTNYLDQLPNVGDLWGTAYDDGGQNHSPTGYFGQGAQVRGKAWGIRALAHATFLSPGGSAWRAGGEVWLDKNRLGLDAFRTATANPLNVIYFGTARAPQDLGPGVAGFAYRSWQNYYLIAEMHKAAAAQLISDATKRAAFATTADWLASSVVRYVTEQPNGGWRYIWGGNAPCGHNESPATGATIGSDADWATQMRWSMRDSPPAASGTWYWLDSETAYSAAVVETTPGNPASYPAYFYAALVAAVERGVLGAPAAWATVQANVSNFNVWLQGFGPDARWGPTPRS